MTSLSASPMVCPVSGADETPAEYDLPLSDIAPPFDLAAWSRRCITAIPCRLSIDTARRKALLASNSPHCYPLRSEDYTHMELVFMIPLAGFAAVSYAAYLAWDVLRRDQGTPEMQDVASMIFEGAMAFLRRQYGT